MRRVLAFLLLLCGAVALCASPALAAAITTASERLSTALTKAKITDVDGNTLTAVRNEATITEIFLYKGSTQLDDATSVAEIDLSGVDCSELIATDVIGSNSLLQIANTTNLKKVKIALTNNASGAGVTVGSIAGAVCKDSLVELDLSGSTGLATLEITDDLAALETLNLSGCNWKNAAGTTGFALTVTSDPGKLKTLDLSGSTIGLTGNVASVVALSAAAGTTVETLNLTNCEWILGFTTVAHFTNLKNLYMSGCPRLNTAGVTFTGLTALEILDISNSATTTTAVPVLPTAATTAAATLVSVDMHGFGDPNGTVEINSLGLGNQTKLKWLDASDCLLVAVVATGNNDLSSLEYLNLSGAEKLVRVGAAAADNNKVLTERLPALKTLNLSGSGVRASAAPQRYISEVDLSGAYKTLVSADLSGMTELETLTLGTNEYAELKELNLTGDTKLADLDLSETTGFLLPVGFLTLEGLENFTMNGRSDLTSIDMSPFEDLLTLELQDDALTTINVSSNEKLTALDVTNNSLTSLDVTKNKELLHLILPNNKVEVLDLSSQKYLAGANLAGGVWGTNAIDVRSNALAKIDLAQNTNIVINPSQFTDPAMVANQTRAMSGTSSAEFDFADLGFKAADMEKILASSLQDEEGNVGTITEGDTKVTFDAAPSKISYKYNVGLYSQSNAEPLYMDVTLSWNQKDGGGDEKKVPVISTASLPDATVNEAYSQSLEATNSPTVWLIASGGDSLTAYNLSMDVAGKITGTPETEGTASFSVIASNDDGPSEAKALTIKVNNDTTETVAPEFSAASYKVSGDAGKPITPVTLSVNDDATTPITWITSPDKLPVSLDKSVGTGRSFVISGTPTGAYSGDIEVTASNDADSDTVTVSINIAEGAGGSGGSSGGCDAGFGALALALVGLVGLKRK